MPEATQADLKSKFRLALLPAGDWDVIMAQLIEGVWDTALVVA